MPKRNLIRTIIEGEELKKRLDSGVEKVLQLALTSYGVSSGDVMIEHRYGEPLISHDGITNLRNLVLEDPIESAVASIIRQAVEKTNRDAGDSTTLTAVLSCLSYQYWSQFNSAPPRIVKNRMLNFAESIKAHIIATKIEVNDETLLGAARISAGDEALGDLVFDAVKTVGGLGGVTVVEVAEPTISSDEVEGFTFKKGLKAIALANDIQAIKSRFSDPAIIVMPKLISKNDEILPVIDITKRAGYNSIVLIADVSGQALESLISNKLNGVIDISVVEPPMEDRDVFLSDIAAYTSAKQFTGDPEDFDVTEYLGSADSVYITLGETTINGVKKKKEFEEYLETVTDKKRLDRLNGKTVKISVGAPTQAERQELKLRIEDAVCAAQTAQDYGVLPGGGVFLRDYEGGKELKYLSKPFELLTAGVPNIDTRDLKDGVGVNIFNNTIVDDMIAAGIVDSAKAIEEAVINSHSAAAQILSIRKALPFLEDME